MVLRYNDIHAFDNYWQNSNYLQYVQSGWDFRTPSMLLAGYNPTPLEGEERLIQTQYQYMLQPYVHTPMNDTRTRNVTRRRRHR